MLSLGLVFDRWQAQLAGPRRPTGGLSSKFRTRPEAYLVLSPIFLHHLINPPRREGSWVMSRHSPLGSDKAELTVLRLGSESVVVFAI